MSENKQEVCETSKTNDIRPCKVACISHIQTKSRSSFLDMAETKTTAVVKGNDYGSQVIRRMDELTQVGFTVPADYNYVNAVKASMMALVDVKDKDKRPALEVCTPASVQQALFVMATKGLNVAKKQGYFIVRGTKLCFQESYFGKVLQAKRIFPNWEPLPRVIYEGDDFSFQTDPETGRRTLLKHEQTLQSLDNTFVGAYLYLPCKDGGQDLYVMSRKMIMAAWSKSDSKSLTTHNQFSDKMVCKTIVNSGCNMIINSTPELAMMADDEFESEHTQIDVPSHEIEEIKPDEVPVAEVVEAPKTKESPNIEPMIIGDDF